MRACRIATTCHVPHAIGSQVSRCGGIVLEWSGDIVSLNGLCHSRTLVYSQLYTAKRKVRILDFFHTIST